MCKSISDIVRTRKIEKSNKNFQPNLGSGQSPQSDLDFNKGNEPVIAEVPCPRFQGWVVAGAGAGIYYRRLRLL
jgi:hypothetical protein